MGWSGIYRSIDAKDESPWRTSQGASMAHTYASTTLVNALRGRTLLGHRLVIDAEVSLEHLSSHFDTDPTDTSWFWKIGVAGSSRNMAVIPARTSASGGP